MQPRVLRSRVFTHSCCCATRAISSTATRWQLPLMLIGIVCRGSAFASRNHEHREGDLKRRWERVFALASLLTPILLGVVVGAIASGKIQTHGSNFTALFIEPWLAAFPFAVGLFALVLFAYLAAVYLTLETDDPELREDFRKRALGAAAAVGLMALVVYLLSGTGAPSVKRDLSASILLFAASFQRWFSFRNNGAKA
jgi:cytochrome d ubiquinol oxidase subunit II